MSDLVQTWLGDAFAGLHPDLQRLHRQGGRLCGPVTLQFGKGLAGWLGRRVAGRMGLPLNAGSYPLEVEIREHDRVLHWSRRFQLPDGDHVAVSRFAPSGRWPGGHWDEQTGALAFRLTVDVVDGGWQWRVLGARLHGIPIPVRLLPRSHAGKRIEQGLYRFEVAVIAPLLGKLVAYGGLLALTPSASPASSPRP